MTDAETYRQYVDEVAQEALDEEDIRKSERIVLRKSLDFIQRDEDNVFLVLREGSHDSIRGAAYDMKRNQSIMDMVLFARLVLEGDIDHKIAGGA